MREPKGSVHSVAPVHGTDVPLPVMPGPVQVGGVEKPGRNAPIVSCSELSTLPELTSPPAACTTSTRLLTVSVSCASSIPFWTV